MEQSHIQVLPMQGCVARFFRSRSDLQIGEKQQQRITHDGGKKKKNRQRSHAQEVHVKSLNTNVYIRGFSKDCLGTAIHHVQGCRALSARGFFSPESDLKTVRKKQRGGHAVNSVRLSFTQGRVKEGPCFHWWRGVEGHLIQIQEEEGEWTCIWLHQPATP